MEDSPLSSYFRQKFLNKRDTAEANYATNPLDADNLTTWGKALLQLSRYENGQESKKMIEDAILKLEEALVIDPLKDDTLFVLGKCFCALISHDPTEAKDYLRKALACFQKASHEKPANTIYFGLVQQLTKELETNKDVRHTIAKMDKGILTFSLDGTFSLDRVFTGASSSEAKDLEMDIQGHTDVEEDKHIHSNAEDMDIDTNEEMDLDIDTNAEMDKGIYVNASDQQFIDAAAASEMKALYDGVQNAKTTSNLDIKAHSSKESSDKSLDEKNDTMNDGEPIQQQEVMGNSIGQDDGSVAEGRARRERKLPVRFRD